MYNNLYIQKDINVTGLADTSAQVSAIDQTFKTAAPEPFSLALMASSLVAVGALLRRKKAQNKIETV